MMGAALWLPCAGFSFWRLLLLWSAASRSLYSLHWQTLTAGPPGKSLVLLSAPHFLYLLLCFLLICFRTALVRYSSHTFSSPTYGVQFSVVFSISTGLWNHHKINFKIFSSLQQEISYLLTVSLPSPPFPSLRQPLIYFLSLWICLFWIFHVNGVIYYVVFYDWFR